MSEEHYRVLGISPDASQAEIKAAYKQRVKETHPDLNDDPNAAEEFQRVKEARDALLGSGAAGAATGAATGGGASGGSAASGSSGTDASDSSSSGRSADRSSSSRGRSDSSGSERGGRSRRRSSDSDRSEPGRNTSTRTEEPSGDRANAYSGASSGSGGRGAGGSASSGSGRRDRGGPDRSETATGASGRGRRSGSSTGDTTGGSTDGRERSSGEAGGSRDYVRFRSVIEEPSGRRAASYDRVVSDKHAPARQTQDTQTRTDASQIPMLLPAFLIVLVKQYLYSLKWALLGLPLTGLYLYGIRGLYYGGQPTATALSFVLGPLGVSLVRSRLGVNFAGTATIPLVYFALVWHPNPSWLEAAIAFHLLPLLVVTAFIAEYK